MEGDGISAHVLEAAISVHWELGSGLFGIQTLGAAGETPTGNSEETV
jgi:hypothetical protein